MDAGASDCIDHLNLSSTLNRYKSEDATSKNSAGVLVQSVNHATGKNTWKVRLCKSYKIIYDATNVLFINMLILPKKIGIQVHTFVFFRSCLRTMITTRN